ncbi:hypothetical protein INT46_009089 [Mucor plumbeus]|uniref:SWIM-type domain-containing protein n=1 Tax=Mucor plumbeus TaxID=97098 RepID=A0A8H7V2E7_9FUNG|nr:hypothetical protein INT46_009089 [Mucor plumbeus]
MSDNSSIDSDMSNTEKELALMLSTFLQEGKQHSIKQHVVIDDDTATNNSSTLSTSFSSLAIQRQSKDIPDELKARSERAVNEHIRLLSSNMIRFLRKHEFKVRGTAGKIYTVTIGPRLECSCRDYQIRKSHCKHILFILLKELDIKDLSTAIFSTIFPSDEILKDVFRKYHPMP